MTNSNTQRLNSLNVLLGATVGSTWETVAEIRTAIEYFRRTHKRRGQQLASISKTARELFKIHVRSDERVQLLHCELGQPESVSPLWLYSNITGVLNKADPTRGTILLVTGLREAILGAKSKARMGSRSLAQYNQCVEMIHSHVENLAYGERLSLIII